MPLLRGSIAACLISFLTLSFQTPDTGFQGVVTSDGKPVAGVTAQAFRAGEMTVAAATKTGADGKYVLGPLTQGVYRVQFTAAGFASETRAGLVVFDKALAGLDVELTPTGSSVPVPDPVGQPTDQLRSGEVGVRVETT